MVRKFFALGTGLGFISLFLFEALSTPTLLWALGVLSAIVGVSNLYWLRTERKLSADVTRVGLPLLWLWAGVAVLFGIESFSVRLAFSIAAALVFIRLQLSLSSEHRSLFRENMLFLSAVGIFLGLWKLQFYLQPSWWLMMAMFSGATFLLTWVGLYDAPSTVIEKFLFSLLLAFLAAEVIWALLFWPIHYVSLTVVFSSLYYLAFVLCRFYLSGSLTRKKIIFHSAVVVIIQVFVSAAAVWLPRP